MRRASVRLDQAKHAGYLVPGHLEMGREAMATCCRPLEARVAGGRVLEDLRAEPAAWCACHGLVHFEVFVLQEP